MTRAFITSGGRGSIFTNYKWLSGDLTYSISPDFSAPMRAAIEAAGALWASVANIRWTEAADAVVRVLPSPTGQAYGWFPGYTEQAGDVWLMEANSTPGRYGHFTAMHEIGHALGLDHPDTGSIYTTVMSYADYPGDSLDYYHSSPYPMTPMLEDVRAMQSLYGANMATNAGDTVYRSEVGQRFYLTIWDAGGIDVLDWSNQSTPAVLDLRDGYSSRVGPLRWDGHMWTNENLWIAYGVTMENALGGTGNDQFYLNDADNFIDGGAGYDVAYGASAFDTLVNVEEVRIIGV